MSKVLYYGVPGGGTYNDTTALTDSGDHKTYNFGTIQFLSGWSYNGTSYAPTVLVDGVISGGVVIPAVSGSNDVVDVSTLTANIDGTAYKGATALAADTDLTITRGGVGTEYIINAITHTGSDWAVVSGTGAASFDLSGGRGGAGQPPYVPVGSIEVAHVRTSSDSAGVILDSEIFMIPGNTREMANSPGGSIEYARVTNSTLGYAGYTRKALPNGRMRGTSHRKAWNFQARLRKPIPGSSLMTHLILVPDRLNGCAKT